MTNMAARSYIGCRRGLEQPQEGAHFWQAFSGVEFEEATPEEMLQGTLMGGRGWSGMEPRAEDSKQLQRCTVLVAILCDGTPDKKRLKGMRACFGSRFKAQPQRRLPPARLHLLTVSQGSKQHLHLATN